MPKIFAHSVISYDTIPGDDELVHLLGDADCGPVSQVNQPDLLIVKPWLIPIKPLMLFGVVLFLVISVGLAIGTSGVLFWGMLVLLWLLVFPALFGLMAEINESFKKKGDFYRVDLQRRTLEICRAGQIVQAKQIIAFTFLSRWYRDHNGWTKTHQTGVLIQGSNGKIDHYPLVRELAENTVRSKVSKWADQLVEVFSVPTRHVELNRSESAALNDY